MKVKIFGGLDESAATCTMEPNGNSCVALLPGDTGFCRITASGLTNEQLRERVRGALFSRMADSPFRVEGVVEAR